MILVDQRDADTLATWGIDAVKLDWCKFNGTITVQDKLTLAFGEALMRTKRPPMFLSFHCGAPWHPWCAQVSFQWKNPDFLLENPDFLFRNPDFLFRNPGFLLKHVDFIIKQPGNARAWRIYKDHHDVWDGTEASTSAIIDVLGQAANHSRPYAWADPGATQPIHHHHHHHNYISRETSEWLVVDADLLMTGGAGCDIRAPGVRCANQTDVEYHTEFSLWAMAAAPLVVSTDLRNLTPLMKEILLHEEILAINQDPIGRSNGVIEALPCGGSIKPNACQWWSKPLTDGGMAVALYNSVNITATNITMPIHLLFEGAGAANIRDVWARKDLGEFHRFSAEVVGHGARVFVVRRP